MNRKQTIDAMAQAFHDADEAGLPLEECWGAAVEALTRGKSMTEADFCKLLRPYMDSNGNAKPKDAYRALAAAGVIKRGE